MYNPDMPVSFFTHNTVIIEHNNMGNLVNTSHIPAQDLTFFEVEDSFTMMQQIAKSKGMQNGEMFDFFTGEKCEKSIEQVSQDEIQKVINENPAEFNKPEILIEKKIHQSQENSNGDVNTPQT